MVFFIVERRALPSLLLGTSGISTAMRSTPTVISAGSVAIGYTLDIHKEHLLDKSGLIRVPVFTIIERDAAKAL
jgi:hypothetical protein